MNVKVPANGEEPSGTEEQAEVHVSRTFGGGGTRKTKFAAEIPAPWDDDGEAKETVMELDYDRTHREWDDVADAWSVDLKALHQFIELFNENGYDVTVDLDVGRHYDDYSLTGQFLAEFRD